tara:strand:+ start:824 stop:1231 length:408 start_codon:yes stop_codon:yes gene_type:complete
MKVSKEQLKKLIKPMVRECLFEEGVLAGVISEVVKGLETQRVVTEGITIHKKTDDTEEKQRQLEEEYERQRQEKIKRLNESASQAMGGIDIFENTTPAAPEGNSQGALSGVLPDDPGVNIDGIIGLAGKKWKQLI